jgi:hypothetical protein
MEDFVLTAENNVDQALCVSGNDSGNVIPRPAIVLIAALSRNSSVISCMEGRNRRPCIAGGE